MEMKVNYFKAESQRKVKKSSTLSFEMFWKLDFPRKELNMLLFNKHSWGNIVFNLKLFVFLRAILYLHNNKITKAQSDSVVGVFLLYLIFVAFQEIRWNYKWACEGTKTDLLCSYIYLITLTPS